MKMSDIMQEGEGVKAGWNWLKNKGSDAMDFVTKKQGYSKLDSAGKNMLKHDELGKEASDLIAKRADLMKLDPSHPELKGLEDKISNIKNAQGQLRREVTHPSDGAAGAPVKQAAVDAAYKTRQAPVPDALSAKQKLAVGSAALAGADYLGSPPGEMNLTTGLGKLAGMTAKVPAKFTGGVVAGVKGEKAPGQIEVPNPYPDDEPPKSSAQEAPPRAPTANESIADILKLSGQKSITSRDNIAGIIRPKEIVALHESKLDECGMGMMGSAPNTPASLSISATAGSGEEVANMLASIMKLAGVRDVTPDMLGGPSAPMPMVKAIDIISRDTHDTMNEPEGDHEHEHEHEEPLTGMEEEYGNTPADATDIPPVDTNQFAYQPNDVETGDRMDGNMPKGKPGVTQESLLQAYSQFKNGQ